MPKKVNVLIDTSPMGNQHAVRGIGMYTRQLVEHLQGTFGVTAYASPSDIGDLPLDLIHYPYFDLFFATLPLRRAKPTVVTIHDVIPLLFPEQYPPGVRGKLNLIKQKLALRSVQAILTDSQASKKDIHQYLGIPKQKIHVVYLAGNPDIVKQPKSVIEVVRNQYKLPEKYLLYVGDINSNKNLPQLIKAMKYLPDDVHLALVGRSFTPQDIPEWQQIETQVAMANVADRIHFLNNITSTEENHLAALYSGAQVYVQPSLYEGFGLPVLEAMQCGTPVVATRNSSLIEVGGEAALYADTNAESLSKRVQEVLRMSQAKRRQLSTKSLAWAAKFSWAETAKQTARVYRLALEEKS